MVDDQVDFTGAYAKLSTPVVLRNALKGSTQFEWSLQRLRTIFSKCKLPFRVGARVATDNGDPTWESECVMVETDVNHFLDWCSSDFDSIRGCHQQSNVKRRKIDGSDTETHADTSPDLHSSSAGAKITSDEDASLLNADKNPLNDFNKQDCFAYASYLYLRDLFPDDPAVLQSFDWSLLGLPDRDGRQTTMWLGSAGANTPCHRDAYGWNAVAQLYGKKRWTLFPPTDSVSLYATRIPYEETSTYSQVNIARPDLHRFPLFTQSRPFCTDLHPGDVLIVPARWWHYVESLESPTFSVNTWSELPSVDNAQRCNEAVAKFVVNSIVGNCVAMFSDDGGKRGETESDSSSDSSSSQCSNLESQDETQCKLDIEAILNPNEHLESASTLLSYIRTAFNQRGSNDEASSFQSAVQSIGGDFSDKNGSLPANDGSTVDILAKRFEVERLSPKNFADWLSSIDSSRNLTISKPDLEVSKLNQSLVWHDNDVITDLIYAFTHDTVIDRVCELVDKRRNMRLASQK